MHRSAWVAKGGCRSCSRPIAKRVEGPGEFAVPCRACSAETVLPAALIELTGAAPTSSPEPARSDPPAESHPPRKRSWLAPIIVVAALFLVGGGLATFVMLRGDDPLVDGPALDAEDEPRPWWESFSVSVVPAFGADDTTFTMTVQAVDENGTQIRPGSIDDPAAFYYGWSDELHVDIREFEGWRSCDPRSCSLSAPNGTYVYLDLDVPGSFGSRVVNTTSRATYSYSYRPSGVAPSGSDFLWESQLVEEPSGVITFSISRSRGVPIYSVVVQVNTSATEPQPLTVEFVQGGTTVQRENVTADPSSFFPLDIRADLPRSNGEISILVEATSSGRRASTIVPTEECASYAWSLELRLDPSGAPSFGPAECVK